VLKHFGLFVGSQELSEMLPNNGNKEKILVPLETRILGLGPLGNKILWKMLHTMEMQLFLVGIYPDAWYYFATCSVCFKHNG